MIFKTVKEDIQKFANTIETSEDVNLQLGCKYKPEKQNRIFEKVKKNIENLEQII